MNEEQKQSKRELLSAWFDGEATDQERMEVERLLEESVDARRDLDEYSQLSELLQKLPSESAPVSISEVVLEQASQQHSTTSNLSATTPANSKSSWLKYVAGFVSTVAALVVITLLLPRPDNNHSEHASDDRAVDNGVATVAQSETLPLYDAAGKSEGHLAESAIADGHNAARRKMASKSGTFAKGGAGAADSPAVSAKTVDDAFGQPRMRVAPRRELKNFRDINWDGVSIGDVLAYQDESGEQVTVVEVTVIDIEKAVGKMQVLLTQNSISEPAFKTAVEEKSKSKQDDGDKNTGYKNIPKAQVALLVKSTKSQLASTFNQLQRDQLFVDLQPHSNVSLTGVQVASADQTEQLKKLNDVLLQDMQEAQQQFDRNHRMLGQKQKEDAEKRATPNTAPRPKAQPRSNKPSYGTDKSKKQPKPESPKAAIAKKAEADSSAGTKVPRAEILDRHKTDQLASNSSYQLLLNIDKPKLSRYDSRQLQHDKKLKQNYFNAQNANRDKKSLPYKPAEGQAQANENKKAVPADAVTARGKQSARQTRSSNAPAKEALSKKDANKSAPQATEMERLQQGNVRVLFVFTQRTVPSRNNAIQKARTP